MKINQKKLELDHSRIILGIFLKKSFYIFYTEILGIQKLKSEK